MWKKLRDKSNSYVKEAMWQKLYGRSFVEEAILTKLCGRNYDEQAIAM